MPELDIASVVLLNPVIAATRFQIVRRRSWTDSNGQSRISAQTVWGIGSVTSPGNPLDRGDDYQSQPATIDVVTGSFLRVATLDDDGVNWQPDLILWQGNHYLVNKVDDFSQFGAGFVAASCDLFEYQPTPPSGNAPSLATGHADFRQRNNSGLLGAVA